MEKLSARRRRRRRRRRHLEIQVDIQARELYLKFFTWFCGRCERYLRMETGVLHRISIQILWAQWFGLGSHFQKSACFDLNSKVTMLVFPGTCSKNNPRQHNTTPGAARPPPPASRPYFQDMRKLKNPISKKSRIWENKRIQYPIFPGCEKIWKNKQFPIFPGL